MCEAGRRYGEFSSLGQSGAEAYMLRENVHLRRWQNLKDFMAFRETQISFFKIRVGGGRNHSKDSCSVTYKMYLSQAGQSCWLRFF